jgi:hypothetical protein
LDGVESREKPGSAIERLKAILVIEAIALGIALVSPVTPSKTGSRWSPAELFTPEPSYLQQAAAAFVTANLIMLLFGIAVFVALRLGRSR